MNMYYVFDFREEWNCKPYVTLWRPDNAGYCYSIPWAGEYTERQVIEKGPYYTQRKYQKKTADYTGIWERVAVRTDLAKPFFIAPAPGIIDGDVGPVIANTGQMRTYLRRLRFILPKERIAA
ncbi:hypothetical protein [Novacetimonas hansenii]|uniref:hypothetical protein n=1 Tax=Novacetimonas hansenii TaxID=436 RepID=UPI0011150FF6|nr:hypothetical protein [Novacetimonas hansenii]